MICHGSIKGRSTTYIDTDKRDRSLKLVCIDDEFIDEEFQNKVKIRCTFQLTKEHIDLNSFSQLMYMV